jgi:putative lipoic acid-binding regulatory protein
MANEESKDGPNEGSQNEPGTAPAPQQELLQFPTDYPIKVVGRPSPEFRARIHAIFIQHAPNVETDRITERLSENGNFLSISYTIVAESREQVVALAKDLAAADGVLMVI